ncbi:MAG TPA: hypothetical protein VJR27_04175 [Candidatus Saccharimonadales bacterium]|nr:hypothetical protein [Candidatus Saccharimonadales bacterium]
MKLLILYRPNSEHASAVESFIRDFQHQHAIDEKKLDIMSLNTRDGAATASLYDVMSYPAFIAIANDGSVLNMWQGEELPLMDEVAGYVYS